MLRVTGTEDGDRLRLRLEGRLATLWVGVLREVVERHRRQSAAPLTLNLAAVDHADDEGLDLLACLQAQGVTLEAVPGHICGILARPQAARSPSRP